MRMFGYTVREQTPTKPVFDENNLINQKRYLYHLAFTPYSDVENFDSIKIRNHNVSYTTSDEEERYTNGKYTFGFGEKQVSNNVILDKDTDEYVYDISVETGHFMCNGILSHNCFAYYIEQRAELDTTNAKWQFDAAYYLQNQLYRTYIFYKSETFSRTVIPLLKIRVLQSPRPVWRQIRTFGSPCRQRAVLRLIGAMAP